MTAGLLSALHDVPGAYAFNAEDLARAEQHVIEQAKRDARVFDPLAFLRPPLDRFVRSAVESACEELRGGVGAVWREDAVHLFGIYLQALGKELCS